jgi:hypothetical protein
MTDHPDHSHGLHYELAAIVAARSVLRRVSRTQPGTGVLNLPVAGLGLMPATDAMINMISPAALCQLQPGRHHGATSSGMKGAVLFTGPESGFRVLTPMLLALLEITSHYGPVAYLEADYLGRDGTQAAAVWRHGQVDIGPVLLGRREFFSSEIAPLSVALRALGVCAIGRRDEFVVAGLGRHRSTGAWARAIPRETTGPHEKTGEPR